MEFFYGSSDLGRQSAPKVGLRVWGLGFGVWGLGRGVSGCRYEGRRLRVFLLDEVAELLDNL